MAAGTAFAQPDCLSDLTEIAMRHALLSGLALLAVAALTTSAMAQSSSPGVFRVEPVAERQVGSLPDGPLYWRIESAPAPFSTSTMDEDYALTGEADGKAWRFTLGPQGARTPGMRLEGEVGPVALPEAPSGYVIRVNRAGGSPGSRTEVHSHPGAEAFLVRKGRLCQRTSHGEAEAGAGETMNGHEPGLVMQLTSCGEADLDQWVMFVLDASQPFSSPARFD